MVYQIDQSGKIEDTSKQTVIACVEGDKKMAIIISAKEKRKLQEYFRFVGMPRLYIDISFSVLIYLLFKDMLKRKMNLFIDMEYPGHTKIIESILKDLSREKLDIEWGYVGKTSQVHDVGFKVYKGKLKIGKHVNAGNVWSLAKKIAGGYLNAGLSPANRHSAPANKKIVSYQKKKVK